MTSKDKARRARRILAEKQAEAKAAKKHAEAFLRLDAQRRALAVVSCCLLDVTGPITLTPEMQRKAEPRAITLEDLGDGSMAVRFEEEEPAPGDLPSAEHP